MPTVTTFEVFYFTVINYIEFNKLQDWEEEKNGETRGAANIVAD
jgi:hypothetical protein